MAWRSPQIPGISTEGYFQFTDMISTSIIRGLHIIGFVVITLGSAGFIILEVFSSYPDSKNIMVGVVVLIFGSLAWRLICEAWILFFRIHESLVDIEYNTSDEQDTDDSVPDWRDDD